MSLVVRIIFLIVTLFVLREADKPDSDLDTEFRTIQNINSNWDYLENNSEDIGLVLRAVKWSPINLPHTWNKWDATDLIPGYRRDGSWYRKKLPFGKIDNKLWKLKFEGANINTKVYVNGNHAGSHVGGYVGFEFDITPYLIEDTENIILVRVDNSYNPDVIPSQKADFIIYGGITRDVWLTAVPINNISQVYISTPEVNKDVAKTQVEVRLNENFKCIDCQIVASITKKSDRVILSTISKTIENNDKTYSLSLPELISPALWSPSNPNLYDLTVQIQRNGKAIDQVHEDFGYRWYSFDDFGAFYLNGEKLLLRGTHRHEEHAGLGSAMPNALHRKDIEMIKELGANFLRLGHYPQDPEVYKACNELGIIVWDEVPWCRGGIGQDTWKANTTRLLEEQINQNFNHPSIFFWSLGNEIYWLPDFEDGGNTVEINKFLTHLNNLAHKLDPIRLTAIRKYYDGADLVDVFSPSIWSGWYAGVYTNYESTLEKNQKKYPKFLHMEYGGSSHVGRHTENPITGSGTLNEDDWEEVSNQVDIKNIAKEGDWTENYMVDLFDWYLSISEKLDDFPGNAQWAFKDFATPLRPENAIPYMNQKGLVDRAGKPKDSYYVYKSYWTEEPMVYIESHTWTQRQGPKGKSREVSVFSNCKEVELFLNGKSLGIKKRDMSKFPACGLNWSVDFAEGKNQLVAKALNEGQILVKDSFSLNYSFQQADKADHIKLKYKTIANDRIMIEATMHDKQGIRVLDYEETVYFSLDGKGELMVNYGTPTRSQVIEMANGVARIEMIPGDGKATIEVRNQEFKGSYLVINPEDIDLKTTSAQN